MFEFRLPPCRLDGQHIGDLPQCFDAVDLTVEVVRIGDLRPALHVRDGGQVLVLKKDPHREAVLDYRQVQYRIDAVVDTVGTFGLRAGQLHFSAKGLEIRAARDVFDGSAH